MFECQTFGSSGELLERQSKICTLRGNSWNHLVVTVCHFVDGFIDVQRRFLNLSSESVVVASHHDIA
jgi:hypothetical protein